MNTPTTKTKLPSRATLVRAYTKLRAELFAIPSHGRTAEEFPEVPRETTNDRNLAFDVHYLADILVYTDAELAEVLS